jgi:hypothetical protein
MPDHDGRGVAHGSGEKDSGAEHARKILRFDRKHELVNRACKAFATSFIAISAFAIRKLVPNSELMDFAWRTFSVRRPGWERVQAVCSFVHEHLNFDYQQARADRTALEAFREQVGVCRDFTHLAIAFCRCLNIPARYATGYLGDIGVPPVPDPMDFSAWFEVYLQGHWYTFDARHNRRRIGRVLIGRGRDAADVPITMSFGKQTLEVFRVITEEIDLAAVSDLSMTQPSGRSQSEIAGARSYNNEHVLQTLQVIPWFKGRPTILLFKNYDRNCARCWSPSRIQSHPSRVRCSPAFKRKAPKGPL